MSDQHAYRPSLPRDSKPGLPEARCPACGKVLARMALEGRSAVEVKCRSCRKVSTFVAGPAASSASDNAPGTGLTG